MDFYLSKSIGVLPLGSDSGYERHLCATFGAYIAIWTLHLLNNCTWIMNWQWNAKVIYNCWQLFWCFDSEFSQTHPTTWKICVYWIQEGQIPHATTDQVRSIVYEQSELLPPTRATYCFYSASTSSHDRIRLDDPWGGENHEPVIYL